ncbi:MAG: ABC transporter permease [Candidatus Doudnabacteria bacterium]|nr:ABC transporter permease [Candidatus Doudnabacteria bacterium]
MRSLLTLTISSIKMFFRNKQALFFTFFSPLMIMVIFGLIGLDRTQKINVGLALSSPPTAGTAQFVEGLKQVPSFDIHFGTETELRDQIQNDKVAAVFLIPPDLIPANPLQAEPKTVTVLTNSGSAQQAGIATSIMNEVLNRTALRMTGGSDLFKLNVQEINTNHLKYVDFLLPGLIALSLMQMSVFSVAFVFTNYKEKGVLRRLIATPMRPFAFVAANVFTRLIVSFLQTVIFVAVGVLYLKAHVIGSYWLIGLITILGSIMFLGLGFTISGIAKTQESVPAFANLIAFPMIFLGGTFFPINSFPTWLKNVATYLPLQFLSDAFRQVMTKNASIMDIRNDLLWMLAWSVVLVFLANWAFSFEEKRQ